MGPIRRGLILATLPTPAFAQACATLRPNWDGTAPTVWGEAILLFSALPSLGLILITALVLRFRSQWGGLLVVILWTLWTSAVALTRGDTIIAARLEGCVGSSTVFILAVALICTGTILYTLPKNTRL